MSYIYIFIHYITHTRRWRYWKPPLGGQQWSWQSDRRSCGTACRQGAGFIFIFIYYTFNLLIWFIFCCSQWWNSLHAWCIFYFYLQSKVEQPAGVLQILLFIYYYFNYSQGQGTTQRTLLRIGTQIFWGIVRYSRNFLNTVCV